MLLEAENYGFKNVTEYYKLFEAMIGMKLEDCSNMKVKAKSMAERLTLALEFFLKIYYPDLLPALPMIVRLNNLAQKINFGAFSPAEFKFNI